MFTAKSCMQCVKGPNWEPMKNCTSCKDPKFDSKDCSKCSQQHMIAPVCNQCEVGYVFVVNECIERGMNDALKICGLVFSHLMVVIVIVVVVLWSKMQKWFYYINVTAPLLLLFCWCWWSSEQSRLPHPHGLFVAAPCKFIYRSYRFAAMACTSSTRFLERTSSCRSWWALFAHWLHAVL